jgi:hypothetical protein
VVAAITIGIKLRASKTFLDIDTFRRAAVAYTPLQRCWRHPNPRSLRQRGIQLKDLSGSTNCTVVHSIVSC